MRSWSPLFDKVVESSLWEEAPFVRVLFMTMLAKKDADHICRADEYQLKKWANLTEEETAGALEILQSPDTKRKLFKQEFDGRRIERVEEGWMILNGAKYRGLIQKLRRREYQTNWQREKREKESKVSPEWRASERRYVAAEKRGDQAGMDAETERQLHLPKNNSSQPSA